MEPKLKNNFKMLIGTVKNYINNLFPLRSLGKICSSKETWANFSSYTVDLL